MVGVDPSEDLLRRFASDARTAGLDVDLRRGRIGDLDALFGDRQFDVVCAHGLLMYLDDPGVALKQLAARLAAGGILSVTFRNAAALAFRPGMRREWQTAVAAFDAVGYVNELGVEARAERVEAVAKQLQRLGLTVDAWYGVRVFTDPAAGDERVVDGADFEELIRAEQLAGSRDPYRQLASQIHLLAAR